MRGGSKGLTVLKRENWSRVAVTCDQAGFIILRHGREGITVHKWSYNYHSVWTCTHFKHPSEEQ